MQKYYFYLIPFCFGFGIVNIANTSPESRTPIYEATYQVDKPAQAATLLNIFKELSEKTRQTGLTEIQQKRPNTLFHKRCNQHAILDHIRFSRFNYLQLEDSRIRYNYLGWASFLLTRYFYYDPKKTQQDVEALYARLPEHFEVTIKTYISHKQRREWPWYNKRIWVSDLYSADITIDTRSAEEKQKKQPSLDEWLKQHFSNK